ncbi:MAG: hypothetical protein B6226_04950 [Candidatus Cloacimonetes bacterium 4572_65]|nr:MAG: hypothetical protein B6226_04950 [Candidatus Cloacimonetes bacterium 4572_65]
MLAVIALVGIIVGSIAFIVSKSKQNKEGKVIGNVIFIFSVVLILSQSFTIVDAGEVGVQILFGKVLEEPLNEGLQAKIPFVNVVRYDIRLQEYTMSSAKGEGEMYGDDTIKAITKDNLEISIDLSVWYMINSKKVSNIYKTIARNNYDLRKKIVRPAVKNVVRNVTTKYNFKETIGKRQEFATEMELALAEIFDSKGITTDRVLIRKIDPPLSVKKSIENKLVEQQNLETKQLELEKAHKDAEIKKAQAQGIADAQEIIQKKLEPLYIQYEAIQAYKELANSNNSTFIIAPTDPNASGMPLILNVERSKSK